MGMADAVTRGSRGFEVDGAGDLLASTRNVDLLRALWSSREPGLDVGPGVHESGAWHVSCHLLGAGGVRISASNDLLWLEVSHVAADDTYDATITRAGETVPLASDRGRELLSGSTLAGFVEGTSEGHISARDVVDSPDRFEGWKRQNYDQPIDSTAQGGRVWEHWCTTRDLDPESAFSRSWLGAFLSLCAALGDRFAPTVARGRTQYGHPQQLRAMVAAGLMSGASATWRCTPRPIPQASQDLLYEARAEAALQAVSGLEWTSGDVRYYMFSRKIGSWAG